jgi:hypothetical protein
MEIKMETKPQVPKKSLTKNISVTRDVEMVGRRRPVVRNAGVELVPRPSDSPLDPLVHPPLLFNQSKTMY